LSVSSPKHTISAVHDGPDTRIRMGFPAAASRRRQGLSHRGFGSHVSFDSPFSTESKNAM
jgi:hypothetical protein